MTQDVRTIAASDHRTHRLAWAWLITCVAITAAAMITGCANPMAASKPSLARSQPAHSPALPVPAIAATHTASVVDVAALYSQPTASTPSIAQVGFRDRLNGCRCGNNACGGGCGSAMPVGDCATCEPAPVMGMPMMRAPWGVDPQEFLCNGGDQGASVQLLRNDRIAGLEPEDTVSKYETERGDIDFAISNRVCVYSPRFSSVRRITGAIANDRTITVGGTVQPIGPRGVDLDLPGLVMTDTVEIAHSELTRRVDAMRDRNRGVPIERVQQIEVAQDVLALLTNIRQLSLSQLDEAELALVERYANAAIAWSIDESVEVEIQDLKPPTLTRDEKVDAVVVYDFPDAGRLNLIKLADRQHVPIGETVTFALRLQNVGDSTVNGVVVTDNLTTRLEYVADSESASMEADFETRPNEAGSDQLVWTLKEELAVGESVTIEFKCRVR